MTDEQINIAIAESLGWTKCRMIIKGAGGGTRYPTAHGIPPNRKYEASCPNYTADLNACRDAFNSLNLFQQIVWHSHLCRIVKRRCAENLDDESVRMVAVNALASERSEAHVRTIGKWEEVA